MIEYVLSIFETVARAYGERVDRSLREEAYATTNEWLCGVHMFLQISACSHGRARMRLVLYDPIPCVFCQPSFGQGVLLLVQDWIPPQV